MSSPAKKPASKKRPSSRTRSGTSNVGSTPTPRALVYLQSLLPPSWERFFKSRPAGNYWGLAIACPKCGTGAPAHLTYASRKWRWLAVHMASCGK